MPVKPGLRKPFLTTGESFWTNSTTELLSSTSKADKQARMRNHCHGHGFEIGPAITLWSTVWVES